MQKTVNRFGLDRYIPAPTRRAVRKECGFGCVICGCGIYDYEHFDPDFADAKDHLASGIALLCGTCHGYVTRGRWSKDRVGKARANPKCLQCGFTRFEQDAFDPDEPFVISFGRCDFVIPKVVLRVYGADLLVVQPPEDPTGPMRVSGRIFDESGEQVLLIDDNQYFADAKRSWDIEMKGARTIIRAAPRTISVQLWQPRPNKVVIERLRMKYQDVVVDADADGIRIQRDSEFDLEFDGVITGADCCVSVDKFEEADK